MKLKILYANHYSAAISGAERVMLNVAAAMRELPDVEIEALCPPGRLADELRGIGIPVHTTGFVRLRRSVNPFFWLGAARTILSTRRAVARLLKSGGFNLLLSNSFIAHLHVAEAAVRSSVPACWHMHDILKIRASNRLLAGYAMKRASLVIAVSEAVKRNLDELAGGAEKTRAALNGIDFAAFDARAASPPLPPLSPKKNGELFAAVVGQIAFFKGQHTVVEAAKLLRKQNVKVKFLIAGDAQDPRERRYFDNLRATVEKDGLADAVAFLGRRDDVPALVSACDILVHASATPDPCPLSVIEYLYSGKAVVASAAGGVPELVRDGDTGLLFPPGDAAALAERVSRLAADPALRQKLGAAARARAMESHNIPRQAAEIFSLLACVAGKSE